MDDVMKQKKAKEMFLSICQALDSEDLQYRKDEEELTITSGFSGEDLPIGLTITVDVDTQRIMLLSRLPYKMSEDKRVDGAIAISAVNNSLVHGCFDYDVLDGSICFRMVSTFMGSLLSREALLYLVYCTYQTVDAYNDKFFMLSKAIIGLEDFLKKDDR